MKRVWEENWASSWDVDTFDIDDVDEPMAPTIASLPAEKPTLNGDRAKLMAAAPDMARMLLRFEWCLAPGGCPACKNLMPYEHKVDCELDAALRKAGVR